ncbi:GSCOCG00005508001-RA-CDS [Cotesia congregata]|nr:GSCOCG00005508001-RA-CDS [Cotesia congregata]
MFLNKVVSKVCGPGVNQLKIIKRLATNHPDYYKSPEKLQAEEEESENPRPRRRLKKWRNMPGGIDQDPGTFLSMFNRQADRDDAGGIIFRGKTFYPSDFSRWYYVKQHEYLQYDQRYLPERNQALGNDLAATHFLIFRHSRIRKKGETEFWDANDMEKIPNLYTQNWYLEEIDASNSEIIFEGIENFKGLKFLKRASFKNCKHFDDWCLDRVIGLCPTLEYLNVSECKKLTDRGLESLYRAWNLKEFHISDYFHSPSFELTCMMVEDCMPQLKINVKKMPKVEIPTETRAAEEPDEEKKVSENKN